MLLQELIGNIILFSLTRYNIRKKHMIYYKYVPILHLVLFIFQEYINTKYGYMK